MKEKIDCRNTKLKFFSENSLTEYSSPVGDYLMEFPFERFDLEYVSNRHEELSDLIDGLNQYFKSYKPQFQFPTGVVSSPYEIWIDKNRIDQLRNGLIPVYVLFVDPYIPNSKGNFYWTNLHFPLHKVSLYLIIIKPLLVLI